jgi:hypothetical protein
MNWSQVLEAMWNVANSPAGIAAAAMLLVYGLNKIYAKKPAWAAFEGAIISGIKFAEKQVPDDTGSKGLARLDAALKYVVAVYEESRGKKPSKAVTAQLKEGIQITHSKLEAAGNL